MRLGTLIAGVFMLLFGAIAIAAVYVIWPTVMSYIQPYAAYLAFSMGTIRLLALAPGAVLAIMGVLLLILGAVLPGQPQMPTTYPMMMPHPQPYAPVPPPAQLMPLPVLHLTMLPARPMPTSRFKGQICYHCGHLAERTPLGGWYCPRCQTYL